MPHRKFSRQLRSAWTDAWEGQESPKPLPMPFQTLLSEPALAAAQRAASHGNTAARELVTYFVGQGVGLVDNIKSCRTVAHEFIEEFGRRWAICRRWSTSKNRSMRSAKADEAHMR
jgi:NAD(P)H-dependent flavin oxidoreductase YrpB (nitropropane dioxygenase family)